MNVILFSQLFVYFITFHLRFSSIFYSIQLSDIFAYELPLKSSSLDNFSFKTLRSTIVVYNFHNLRSHDRFFFFTTSTPSSKTNFKLHSLGELYSNSN